MIFFFSILNRTERIGTQYSYYIIGGEREVAVTSGLSSNYNCVFEEFEDMEDKLRVNNLWIP